MNAQDRKRESLLKRLARSGAKYAKNAAERESLRWIIASESFALRATYPAGGEAAFKAAAATATGFAESDIGNLVRAYECRESLTADQRKRTQTWTTDAMLTLRGKDMTPAKRTQLIKWSEDKGTQNVKRLREQKGKIVGRTPRKRQSKTDAKIALAKSLAKDFERIFKNHEGPARLAFIAGVQFAMDKGADKDTKDIAAALIFADAQVSKATPVVK